MPKAVSGTCGGSVVEFDFIDPGMSDSAAMSPTDAQQKCPACGALEPDVTGLVGAGQVRPPVAPDQDQYLGAGFSSRLARLLSREADDASRDEEDDDEDDELSRSRERLLSRSRSRARLLSRVALSLLSLAASGAGVGGAAGAEFWMFLAA